MSSRPVSRPFTPPTLPPSQTYTHTHLHSDTQTIRHSDAQTFSLTRCRLFKAEWIATCCACAVVLSITHVLCPSYPPNHTCTNNQTLRRRTSRHTDTQTLRLSDPQTLRLSLALPLPLPPPLSLSLSLSFVRSAVSTKSVAMSAFGPSMKPRPPRGQRPTHDM